MEKNSNRMVLQVGDRIDKAEKLSIRNQNVGTPKLKKSGTKRF